MIPIHPLGSNSGCINLFFELPILVPTKTPSLQGHIMNGLEMMLGGVTLSQFTDCMLRDADDVSRRQVSEWIAHHSIGDYSVTLYTILEEGRIHELLKDAVSAAVKAREAITDHIQGIANDLDKRLMDVEYDPGSPSAQVYASAYYNYKRTSLVTLCQLCADYISALKLLEYFVTLATVNQDDIDASKRPSIPDVNFSWVKGTTRLARNTDCLTDERICTLYVMLNARITLLVVSDFAGELTKWNESLYNKETSDNLHRIGHECGVCMGIISAILHDGDQFKGYKPERLKMITDTGIIPNIEALSLLYKWMFLYKKHVTFMNIIKKHGLTSGNNTTHRDYATGMGIWCDDVFVDMIQSETMLKPHMVDIQRVFKWVYVCAHICKLLSLYYNMEKNLASSLIEYALYWKEKIVAYLETDVTKAVTKYHQELYKFERDHGAMNDMALYEEYIKKDTESDDSENSEEDSDNEVFSDSLKTANILFETQYLRGFHVGDYTQILTNIKRSVKTLDAENAKIYYNTKSKKPTEESENQDVIDKMRERLDNMNKEEVYCEFTSTETRSLVWDIIIGVSKYIGVWFKTRILDHCK